MTTMSGLDFWRRLQKQGRTTPAGSTLQAPLGPQGPVAPSSPASNPFSALLAELQSLSNAQSVSDRASRNAAIQQALIRYGQVPANLNILGIPSSDLSGIVTPDIASLANQNTLAKTSTVARLTEADANARSGIENSLAARGMYRSGELGTGLGNEQTAYTRAQYDATNALLDYLAGVQSAFAQAEAQRQRDLINAAMGLPPDTSGGGGGGSGTYNPNIATGPGLGIFNFSGTTNYGGSGGSVKVKPQPKPVLTTLTKNRLKAGRM